MFPALAVGVGEYDQTIMEQPPRDPDEPILTSRNWFTIFSFGGLITVAVLTVFGLALLYFDWKPKTAVTVSFLTLAFSQLWHVFDMRYKSSGIFKNEVTTNGWVWGAIVLCVIMLVAAVYLPGLSDVLNTAPLDPVQWLLVLAFSLSIPVIGQGSALVINLFNNS